MLESATIDASLSFSCLGTTRASEDSTAAAAGSCIGAESSLATAGVAVLRAVVAPPRPPPRPRPPLPLPFGGIVRLRSLLKSRGRGFEESTRKLY